MIITSEFPPVEVVDLPIHDAVLGRAQEYGDRPALVDGVSGRELSYAQLDLMSRRVAAGFAELGIRHGDTIALYSPNTILYPVVFYGATRAGATVTTVNALYTADELPEPPPGAVGKLFPSTELRLVGADGNDVPDGESGEIWIRGPQVMKGYLGGPAETEATIDRDGWLHTGDIGRMDARGYLYVVDRVKELIKYHGYQVPPAELEAVLLTDERIADAAVIGVQSDGNEVPKAFVVPMPGVELTEDDVIEYVGARVAPYKKIRQVEFIEAVPKAASGKILRRELRAREAARE